MKIEIAEHGRMTESGSSLLRLIQNQDIPLLDLLVRESVQNSLDATANPTEPVQVDIRVGEFVISDLNRHFEKIEAGLNRRYSERTHKYIAVKDCNTVGLTGPVRYADVRQNQFGNLLKLVYEISKPQSNEGAGGSWGLGKTIYFRLGIGLVIYYSRIFQDGKYSSRLAACLVEDETRTDALIPNKGGVKRGIAWWGKRDGFAVNDTVPIDNESEIEKILKVFHIAPYRNSETGTTVIIPYINENDLLREAYAINEEEENKPYWASSVDEYLNVAFQRWYAPRLLNAKYPYGSWLQPSVNGERMKVSRMLSTFRYIRELYMLATGVIPDEEFLLREQAVDYHVESIDLRGVLDTTSAGKFAYAKFTRKQLQMEPPINQKSPYQQIQNVFVPMENGNGPIVAYTRRPGMIVGYDYDSTWTHRMPKSNANEYIIGMFVANSMNTLKNITVSKSGKKMTLEEYIRQGEKADHASWTDRNIAGHNLRIVANVQKHVINKIKKKYTETVKDTYERQNVGLGHALANMLLPESDFGSASNLPSKANSRGVKKKSVKKSGIYITGGPVYSDGGMTFDVEIHIKDKPVQIALQVITDFKKLDADVWEADGEIGKKFPLEFQTISITSIQLTSASKKQSCHLYVDISNMRDEDSNLTLALTQSEMFKSNSYTRICSKSEWCILEGKLSFAFSDNRLKGGFELKEIENE